ncbi:MAG: carbon-nitrogen hydrolase family protein [Ruminococcaceae bacterium]|nr:carbon-nitrogen hydrolase family protein [Oscillospiraceae bacterium]
MARYVKISTFTVLNPIPEAEIKKDRPLYESVKDYLDRQLKNVLADKPDLIVLPENCGKQSSFPERAQEYCDSGSLYLFDYFKSVAKENKCYIAFSRYKKMEDGTVRNCASVIGRDGEVVGEYHKNYPTVYETEAGILAGRDVPLIECDFGTICPIICFDLNFDDVRQKVKAKNPDIVTFHSAFHGGLMQEFFAYDTRSYLVSSLQNIRRSKILSPMGVTVATTTTYTNWATAVINLDYAVCHIDYNWAKFAAAKEKYKDKLKIEDPDDVGAVMLSYEGDDKTVMDIISEFEIELLDEYIERSIKNRGENIENIVSEKEKNI